MSGIVDRLRSFWKSGNVTLPVQKVCGDAADEIERLRPALESAQRAIAALPKEALGYGDLSDFHTGEITGQYPLQDELLAEIAAALTPDQSSVSTPPADEKPAQAETLED